MASRVPHSFPIAKRDVGVFDGIGLNIDSMPFPMVRLAMGLVLGGATALLLIVWLTLVTVAYLYTHIAVSGVLMAVGAIAFALLWLPWARRRTFRDQCAHTFILAQIITRGTPGTRNVVPDARRFVVGELGDVEELDSLLNSVAARSRTVLRKLRDLTSALPSLGKVTDWLTRTMLPYIQSIVIGYVLLRRDGRFREAADDALVYVAQNAKPLVGACLRAVIAEKLIGALILIFWLAVFGGAAWFIAGKYSPDLVASVGQIPLERRALASLIINGLAAAAVGLPLAWIVLWIVRGAFIRPALTAFVLSRFLQTIQTQPLNERFRTVLDGASDYLRTGRVRVRVPLP